MKTPRGHFVPCLPASSSTVTQSFANSRIRVFWGRPWVVHWAPPQAAIVLMLAVSHMIQPDLDKEEHSYLQPSAVSVGPAESKTQTE